MHEGAFVAVALQGAGYLNSITARKAAADAGPEERVIAESSIAQMRSTVGPMPLYEFAFRWLYLLVFTTCDHRWLTEREHPASYFARA